MPAANPTPQRFITITFDDGLITGAKKAAALLDRFGIKASFFIVTGWVEPKTAKIHDPWNKDKDHGVWSDWQAIANRGHEVGSHTRSHLNVGGKMARYFPPLVHWNIKYSYTDLRQLPGESPFTMAMPFNTATAISERLVKRYFDAALVGNQELTYNRLAQLDWYRLASWAPNPGLSVRELCDLIASVPDDHWLILQFHSLDDEGWMPFESTKFEELLRSIAAAPSITPVTVRDMVAKYKSCMGTPSSN